MLYIASINFDATVPVILLKVLKWFNVQCIFTTYLGWRLHMSEKFSSGIKNPKQTNKQYLGFISFYMEKGIVFNSNNMNPLAKGNGFNEIGNWFWRRIIFIQKLSMNFQYLPITTFLRKKSDSSIFKT